jgi:hypothetical protein
VQVVRQLAKRTTNLSHLNDDEWHRILSPEAGDSFCMYSVYSFGYCSLVDKRFVASSS